MESAPDVARAEPVAAVAHPDIVDGLVTIAGPISIDSDPQHGTYGVNVQFTLECSRVHKGSV